MSVGCEKFNFEWWKKEKQKKKWKVRRKRDVIDFFVYSFSIEMSAQTECDVSNFQWIYSQWTWHCGGGFWRNFNFSSDFFFFLFIYIFTEQRPHSWELCEISWIFPLEFGIFQNFRLFFSFFLPARVILFQQSETLSNRCYANNLKQHSIRLIGENYQRQQQQRCDNRVFSMCFDFNRTKKLKSNDTQNVNDLREKWHFLFIIFFPYNSRAIQQIVITAENLIKVVHKA